MGMSGSTNTLYVLMGHQLGGGGGTSRVLSGNSKQISICGLVPVKLCNLFTKNKTFEIVKMEGLAGAAG